MFSVEHNWVKLIGLQETPRVELNIMNVCSSHCFLLGITEQYLPTLHTYLPSEHAAVSYVISSAAVSMF